MCHISYDRFDGKEIELILLLSCQIIGKYIIGTSFM